MIAVTGASGGVGTRTIAGLLAGGADVVALTSRPHAVSAPVTVREAGYDDPASLRAGLEAVRTLVFVSSDGRAEPILRHHEHVVGAAVAAGVEHVVYTSILGLDPGFYYAPGHRQTEAWLRETGMRLCLARTSIFTDFFADTWLRGDTLAVPADDAGMSLVTRDDVGAALAAAALRGHEGVVELTGPAALTAAEIAAARGIAHEPIGAEAYRARLVAAGAEDWLVQAFTTMFAAVREGHFATVGDGVERLTGRPAAPFTG